MARLVLRRGLLVQRGATDTARAAYELESGRITVVFRNNRAIGKCSTRYETVWWDRLRPYLTRVRAAVGL